MGRIFWKTFLLTLIAQVVATLAISFALQLTNSKSVQQEIERTPLAGTLNQAASTALQFGGIAAVKKMAINIDPHHAVCILNNNDADLLECGLSTATKAQVRNDLNAGDAHSFIETVQTNDGQQYLIFTIVKEAAEMQLPIPDLSHAMGPPPDADGNPGPLDHPRGPPPGRPHPPGDPMLGKVIPLGYGKWCLCYATDQAFVFSPCGETRIGITPHDQNSCSMSLILRGVLQICQIKSLLACDFQCSFQLILWQVFGARQYP